MGDDLITNVLNEYNSFTKEEYEIINTYINKKEAEYEKKRAERIANTDIKYLIRRKYIEKYYDDALKHKELLLNNALEEFNAHKEIMLQCLSILQSLVNNPNVLDTLIDFLDKGWYGNQNFKEFIVNIINTEIGKIKEIHMELYGLRNCPIMFFIPELYGLSLDELRELPAYIDSKNRLLKNYIVMTDENHPFIP